jgi:hypothetical protein
MADVFHHCRGLAAPVGRLGSVVLALLTGHLVVFVALFVCCALHAIGAALWEGIRPRVVAFGSASALVFFDWVRRKIGLPPET